MTDSSTWVAAKKDLPNLQILFRGDPFLINTYHALCHPEGTTPGQTYAAMFIDFVSSGKGRNIFNVLLDSAETRRPEEKILPTKNSRSTNPTVFLLNCYLYQETPESKKTYLTRKRINL